MERERTTKSGALLEIDFFPVFNGGRRMTTKPPRFEKTVEAQAKYNMQQAIKKTIRIINENFTTGDIFMHPTYQPHRAPQSYEKAAKDITNYIRRVKTRRASELKRVNKLLKENPDDKKLLAIKKKLEQPFKYYVAIEEQIYKTGVRAGKSNWHFHLFMTGGIDRDTLEDMWPNGIRTNADRFQPEKFGPEAAARYICKDAKGKRRFRCSKNMSKPKVKDKDGHITRRTVERLATQRVDDKIFWEKKYKGYRFIRCYPRFNQYNGHWYVSVIMYRSDCDIPQWQVDDWITTDY